MMVGTKVGPEAYLLNKPKRDEEKKEAGSWHITSMHFE